MRDLIRVLLTPNPSKRPDINQLAEYITKFNKIDSIPLSDDALEIKRK